MMTHGTAAAIQQPLREREGMPTKADIARIDAIEHRQRTVRKIFTEDEAWMHEMLSRYPMYFNERMERGRGK